MPRVILKYRSIVHGNMKSIYLEFNPPIRDVKGKSVRYECLNLEIYASPETCQQLKQNKEVEEVAETIRCERYLQLVRSDYSFLAKARLDDDNPDVYRAGLFSIYTGLRRSDILALQWENIHHDRGRKAYLRFCIKKTGAQVQTLFNTIQAPVRMITGRKRTGSTKARALQFNNGSTMVQSCEHCSTKHPY